MSPEVPYPPTIGAQQRRYHLLRAYAEAGWAVSLVAICQDAAEAQASERLRPYCDRITIVPVESTKGPTLAQWPPWRRRLAGAVSPLPWAVQRSRSPLIARLIEEACRTDDVVHFSRIWCAGDAPRTAARARLVIDFDDVESLVQRRTLAAGLPPTRRARAWSRLEAVRLRSFEQYLARRTSLVVVCSDLDRTRVGGPRVAVVPNGVDVADINASAREGAGDGRTILFVGFLPYAPNADAVRFFARGVLPRVRSAWPSARFVVVGKGREALHDARGEGVEFVGEVPDLAPFYSKAALAVAPLRVGGGTRIKILEAFAWLRPVVATTIGAEALPVESGRHLLVADAEADLAEHCVRLLTDDALRRALALNARVLVERFDWARLRPLLPAAVGHTLAR